MADTAGTFPSRSQWSASLLSVLVDSTLGPQQVAGIAQYLAATPQIRSGVGTHDSPCSIAALNLALSGVLTDTIPSCMSSVVGTWIMWTQDAMPDEVRNGDRWRMLLPLAAGTGSGKERARLDVVLTWMWEAVAFTQSVADEAAAGGSWRAMRLLRSPQRALRAATAVELAGSDEGSTVVDRGRLVDIAKRVAVAADVHADVAVRACAATRAAVAAIELCESSDVWSLLDPVETLVDLIAVSAA